MITYAGVTSSQGLVRQSHAASIGSRILSVPSMRRLTCDAPQKPLVCLQSLFGRLQNLLGVDWQGCAIEDGRSGPRLLRLIKVRRRISTFRTQDLVQDPAFSQIGLAQARSRAASLASVDGVGKLDSASHIVDIETTLSVILSSAREPCLRQLW